jgi:membrane associated rhomboid family serine protease
MRPAAVGFHCPDCVAEAARTTPTPRTAAGGLVPSNPGRVTMTLIGLNVAMFFLVASSGGRESQLYLESLLLIESRPELGLTGVDQGAWWRLFSSTFLHLQLLHLAFNMFALYTLGPPLERVLGHARFLAVYLLSAFAGSVAVLYFASPLTATLGASGAVFGIFGAAIVLMRSRGYDVGAWVVLLGINLVITFAVANISWQAHLGGLIVGGALGIILAYTPRKLRGLVHPLVLGGVAVALAAATLLHMAA